MLLVFLIRLGNIRTALCYSVSYPSQFFRTDKVLYVYSLRVKDFYLSYLSNTTLTARRGERGNDMTDFRGI